ncbi:hypothetical protein [Paenibacillus sp. FSL P4-0288]|uniref:hypothetical protein n=1 Tax=Paenibacillus sp. FSL P4-0288 TaxID=2921633 RepID=UPI0030FC299F
MKLYHSTCIKLSVIDPMIGNYRHDGEDPRAVNQPVVYLTTDKDELFWNVDEEATYKYVVEIDENDPDLCLDVKDYEFKKKCNEELGVSVNNKWYFYLKPINVSETFEWNGQCYIQIPNF